MDLPTIEIEAEYFRLIPSRFPPVPLYARIAPEEAWAGILAVEQFTNPRLAARTVLAGAVKEVDSSPRFQNWNHAPFVYGDPDGSRFLDSRFGTLELADSRATALAVSVRRREQFLSMTSEPTLGLDMRLLRVPVSGAFADGRDLPPALSQAERWRIGLALFEAGTAGIVYPCPIRAAGACLSVFDPGTLGRSIQAEHYRFVWNGTQIPTLYDFQDGEEITVKNLW